MPKRALVFAVAVVIALLGVPLLSTTDISAKRDRLRPTPCTVEPRTLADDSSRPAATPLPPEMAGFVVDAFVDSPDDLPEGEPASDEIVAEIEAFLQEYAGCTNSGSSLQLTALMTDNALAYVGGLDVAVEALDSQRFGDASAQGFIKWITVSDVRVLPNGRVGGIVDQAIDTGEGGGTYTPLVFLIFEHVDDGWLIDGQITIESDDYATISPEPGATPTVLDDEAVLDSARNGFTEVDSAIYAEPTMVGAKFSLEAMVMVDSDVYPADVGCEIFFFERGEVSATVSAYCRADTALAGRAGKLVVTASGPLLGASGPAYRCEDVAPLADFINFSCTVELPPETR